MDLAAPYLHVTRASLGAEPAAAAARRRLPASAGALCAAAAADEEEERERLLAAAAVWRAVPAAGPNIEEEASKVRPSRESAKPPADGRTDSRFSV